MSKIYEFTRIQQIPVSIDTAWDFFSDARNLLKITPAELRLKITSPNEEKINEGQIITYTVKPVLGIGLSWKTLISKVVYKKYFIDEQLKGPFSIWKHQHYFAETPGGVEMKDIIQYKIPFWVIGDFANFLFVKNKLKKIFDHRAEVIKSLFVE